jgi:DtxR family Mn-dependent transcriptional regulator
VAQHKSTDLSESLEDYLEAILNVSAGSGIARARDVARTLGVARSSVTGALRLLSSKGLVNYRPYDYITLTAAGASQAARVARKHSILNKFFIDVIGVDPRPAQETACRIEHALGPAVMRPLVTFVDFVMRPGEDGVSLADRFRQHRTEKHRDSAAGARTWKQNKNR